MGLSGYMTRGRRLRNSAMGIALSLSLVAGAGLISEPAHAAKKKDKAPKLKPSKGFAAVAGPAQEAINKLAADDAGAVANAKAELEKAFAAVETGDDKFFAGSFAVNLGSKLRDPSLQRRGIKAMLESGMAGDDEPRFNAIAGQFAYQAKDYAEAQLYLQRAVDAGYREDNLEALLAEAYIANNQVEKGLSMLGDAILAGRQSGTLAPESWYRRGIGSAYSAKDIAHVAQFGAMFIADYPQPGNVGVAVTVVRDLGNFGAQETLDLMRLMGRSKSYNEPRDYVEYIQAADPRRLPGEVLDIVNAGLAAGQLKMSDPFVSDAKEQATLRASADRASLASFEADARKPSANEATATGAADAFLSYGQAAKAEELYSIALTKTGADMERILTRQGIAQFDQGKYGEAQKTFARITGKRAPIAQLWAAYAQSKAPKPAAQPAAPAASEAAQ